MQKSITRRSALVGASSAGTLALQSSSAAASTPKALPKYTMTQGIPDSDVGPATRWLVSHYGDVFRPKLARTPIPLSVLCALACQESAYTWYEREVFKRGRSADEMMRLLVLDNVQTRGAFPRGTEVFVNDRRYKDVAPDLIKVSDESRKARGYPVSGKLLYGYGLFQYDLQNIETDPAFWRETPANAPPGSTVRGLWGDVGACTDRAITELKGKLKTHDGNLRAALVAYNGGGKNARDYGEIVWKFYGLAAKELKE